MIATIYYFRFCWWQHCWSSLACENSSINIIEYVMTSKAQCWELLNSPCCRYNNLHSLPVYIAIQDVASRIRDPARTARIISLSSFYSEFIALYFLRFFFIFHPLYSPILMCSGQKNKFIIKQAKWDCLAAYCVFESTFCLRLCWCPADITGSVNCVSQLTGNDGFFFKFMMYADSSKFSRWTFLE